MNRKQRRAMANAANAQFSTGPRTEEGKAASSQNALAHGLSSQKVVLPHEDQAAFDRSVEELNRYHGPANERERTLVFELAAQQWRVQRALAAETAMLDQLIKKVLKENAGLAPEAALGVVYSDRQYAKQLSLMLRYGTAIDRAYQRALKAVTEAIHTRLECERLRRRQRIVTEMREQPQPAAYTAPQPSNGFVSQSAQQPGAAGIDAC